MAIFIFIIATHREHFIGNICTPTESYNYPISQVIVGDRLTGLSIIITAHLLEIFSYDSVKKCPVSSSGVNGIALLI